MSFAHNTSLIVYGALNVNGASANPVTFTRSGASGSWDGIQFQNGGSGTITYATIDYATKGVYLSSAGGVTIDNCTFRNFSEQGVYSLNSSPTVKNCAIQNPAGASHGIYLSGSGNPTIQNNTIDGITPGIERSGSPGSATIYDNTIKNCVNGLKTYQSAPEMYNNSFDGNVYGIRLATSSSPDIHDNDLTTNAIGVYLEQSQPSRVKWNNFGWSGFVQENADEGILVNYLQAGNTFLDNQWNNFYDGEVTRDISNPSGTLLKARGNYWSSFSVTGQVDAGSPQSSHNNDAGPGGALGKIAGREFTETSATGAPVAASFGLEQNFPNPFNPSTVIRFRLSAVSKVTLSIFDLLGRRVRTLASNRAYGPGAHTLTWNGVDDSGKQLASGLYIYRLEAGTGSPAKRYEASRKLVFIR